MNTEVPKQFLLLAGIPVLMHSIRAFYRFDAGMQLIVTLPEIHLPYWQELCTTYSFDIAHQVVPGGDTRFQSVKNALAHISDEGLVAIHDGVRPLVSSETLERTFTSAGKYGNAVPVMPMVESVRETVLERSREVDRCNLRIVQTPQVFRKALIKKAYALAAHENFTDDATVAEAMGEIIHLVEGNPENIKITRPSDLLSAAAILAASSSRE
jgi:2-C-methyl-D-erythritol 4-phosphate cytidylyltransferase